MIDGCDVEVVLRAGLFEWVTVEEPIIYNHQPMTRPGRPKLVLDPAVQEWIDDHECKYHVRLANAYDGRGQIITIMRFMTRHEAAHFRIVWG